MTVDSGSPLDFASLISDDQPPDALNLKQGSKPFGSNRIRQAEHDLYGLFPPSLFTQNEASTPASPPTAAQIWQILCQLAAEDGHPGSSLSFPSSFIHGTHHLRKLAPYAPHVARILQLEGFSATAEEETIELARWCFLSSILFGAPPIPAKPPADLKSPRGTHARNVPATGSSGEQVHDVPQSRWPSKSARHVPHVFSQSKAERQEDIDQCQRPYLHLLKTISRGLPQSNADRAGTEIDNILSEVESSTRSLAAATKGSTRGHTLQNTTIQERAFGPVIELLRIWLDSHLSLFRDADDQVLDSVSEGLAAALRVVYHSDMEDLAVKLQSRPRLNDEERQQDPVISDEYSQVVTRFLGACLLRNLDTLSFRLNRATKGKHADGISTLWELCAPIIRHIRDDDTRTKVLSLFLTVSVTSITNGATGAQKLKSLLSEIYTLLPRPTPLPVYHALLSMYAGIHTGPSDGNQESGHTTVSSEASLANLISTWSRMREEKVTPDIKAYMLLLTGLGKKGDYQALQQAWEELIGDADCKAMWQKEANQSE